MNKKLFKGILTGAFVKSNKKIEDKIGNIIIPRNCVFPNIEEIYSVIEIINATIINA
tara:strand:- start:237 stop:407 length:171 start_codon:yes stop_codon:yes gene_type:complete